MRPKRIYSGYKSPEPRGSKAQRLPKGFKMTVMAVALVFGVFFVVNFLTGRAQDIAAPDMGSAASAADGERLGLVVVYALAEDLTMDEVTVTFPEGRFASDIEALEHYFKFPPFPGTFLQTIRDDAFIREMFVHQGAASVDFNIPPIPPHYSEEEYHAALWAIARTMFHFHGVSTVYITVSGEWYAIYTNHT